MGGTVRRRIAMVAWILTVADPMLGVRHVEVDRCAVEPGR